ncbi:hypothetical protein P7M53_26755, partial [Vibrio parahaemolyticus]|nr:hypothetical protein [Vibrio parahaemolyticus]
MREADKRSASVFFKVRPRFAWVLEPHNNRVSLCGSELNFFVLLCLVFCPNQFKTADDESQASLECRVRTAF